MRVTLVAMMGKNRVIGQNGRVPWHIPEDMVRFKNLTIGHPVIMGRKTWETLDGPLAGRENVVVTRRAGYAAEGARTASSLDVALAPYQATGAEVFVIGGGEIFLEALPLAQRIELTLVDETPEGDAFFPEIPEGTFVETSREDRSGPPRHSFVTFERIG